ncbi:ABC transporter permease [Devosia sp. FKR38]|uniref:ABC transporter permease n=1 Tax=Devosia sp. FKR38 TaxID=2562312 RepID=UPI0010C0D277|nr:ABC transporter permease [Devosia sp. FKR38]
MTMTLETATIPKPSRLMLAALALGLIILAGFLAPLISPHDPDAVDLLNRAAPPVGLGGSWGHALGTDQIGRDILSRCLWGIRTSFGIATLGLVFSAVLGVTLGIISGLAGAWTDRIIMTVVDVFISLPNLLLMLCGIALLGTETWVLVVLIGFVKWEGYARLVRGQVLAIREQGYIEAARVLGARNLTIALRHVLPNLASPLAVILTLSFPGVLLMEAGLSFLGVGVQPPVASLGRMIDDGRNYLVNAWWISGMPSIVIVAITLLFQIIGDAIRDRVDEWLDA